MNNRSDATTVSVALSLYQGAPVGERPDSEDLAALYEGRLASGRRTEVLSYLANDESLYSQWLMFFEHAEELDLLAQAAIPVDRPERSGKPVSQGQKVSFVEKLSQFFNVYTLTSGAGLAGVAAFVLFLNVSQTSGLDQLYHEYGTVDSKRFELPTRSLGNLWGEPEPEQFILSQGFKAGLDRLSVDASGMELLAGEAEQPVIESLGKDEEQTFRSIGEWAALTQFQCPDGNADYYFAADQVWATLQTRLEAIDGSYASTLVDAAQKVSESELTLSGRVCNLAAIVARDVRL